MQIAFIGIDLDASHGILNCDPITAAIDGAAVLITSIAAVTGCPMISA
jgi:hypothetical protein